MQLSNVISLLLAWQNQSWFWDYIITGSMPILNLVILQTFGKRSPVFKTPVLARWKSARSGASCFTGQVPELLQTLMSVNGGAPGTSLRQDRGAVVNRFPSNASELDWGNDLLAEFSSEFLNSSLNYKQQIIQNRCLKQSDSQQGVRPLRLAYQYRANMIKNHPLTLHTFVSTMIMVFDLRGMVCYMI